MPAPLGHEPYNKNGEGGRPPIYTKEFIENEALLLEEWMKNPNNIFFKRFALERGYDQSELGNWAKSNERFGRTYKRLKEWQECKLFEGGLLEQFNAKIVALGLSHHCDYKEKSETKLSGDALNPIHGVLSIIQGDSKDLINGESESE